MTKLLDHNYIEEQFKKEGYSLLSKYKGNRYKLDFICPKGHKYHITYGRWQQGHRCKKCATERLGTLLRFDFEKIRKSFEVEGFILLSKEFEYKNNKKSKLRFICPNGHKHYITWSLWKRGGRCKFCLIDGRRLTIDFVRSEFEKEGYKLTAELYKNNLQLLDFICPKGHIYKISYADWSMGKRCGMCAGNKLFTICNIKQFLEKEGYKVISNNYVNSKEYLQVCCPKGHKYEVKWNVWSNGHRCPICCKNQSNAELDVYEYIKTIIPDEVLLHNKKLIYPYELDIVIPSKKIAVEYCGVYWHNEQNGKDKHYHLNKLEETNIKGYKLITILEDEWLHKQNIVKARLRNILNVYPKERINARDCVVNLLPTVEAREFCNKFHLQGWGICSIKLGLIFDGNLVAVMTFSVPSIAKGSSNKNNGTYELNRYCTDPNYLIRGGASKLLAWFTRNMSFKSIFSYADRRWSNGDLYYKLGFNFIGNTEPNYWYIFGTQRYHRFNFRKSVLRKFSNYDPNLTEREIMESNKYHRLWDCGNMKFELLRK